MKENIKKRLVEVFGSRFVDDTINTASYATDASIYQWKPLGICFPKTEQDIEEAMSIAKEYQIPVLCRGGGTSLAGQTVNQALILDFSKYYTEILSYDPAKKTIRVQPGLVLSQLNAAVKKDGLHFAPDPATANRATIGGMIANNSSGARSIRYGKTQDHIISMRVLLPNGERLEFKTLTQDEVEQKTHLKTKEGAIYKNVRAEIFKHSADIEKAYPKVMRRVSGYNLDAFINEETWNLSELICGSEGSLGIILDVTLNLEKLPVDSCVFMVHFDDRIKAIEAVQEMVKYEPTAVEMLDFNVLDQSKLSPSTKTHHDACIIGDPRAVMLVEFSETDRSKLTEREKTFLEFLKKKKLHYTFLKDQAAIKHAWDLRKKGLGLIMGEIGDKKPIPFIEDCTIPLKHLASYVRFVLELCTSMDVETVVYAHASVGVLHIRPKLDLRTQEGIDKMKIIGSAALEKVKAYGGSWSGEHGDGRIRSVKLEAFFGTEVYHCIKRIKQIFDPQNLLNPGIIADPIPEDAHLRYGPDYRDSEDQFVFQYHKERSFQDVVHNCSGVGACRKVDAGVMCPSYMATLDESHSTRGRANVLRLAMSGQLGEEGLSSDDAWKVMDLCISCKACKSECPSHVDMSKLKAEVLQKKYDKQGITLRERLILNSMDMAKYLHGWKAHIVNPMMRNALTRSVLSVAGISASRKLPAYSTSRLKNWQQKKPKKGEEQVYLFGDSYLKYHRTDLAKKIIGFLEKNGFEVLFLDIGCCQRPKISNGFLNSEKAGAERLAHAINDLNPSIPIIACEPSCYSSLKEDLPDLLDKGKSWDPNQIISLEDFVAQQINKGRIQVNALKKSALVHAHCHQKSVNGLDGLQTILDTIYKDQWEELDAGCCGMAGSFGYEKEHAKISRKMANRKLIPAMNQASSNTDIIVTGFSCSHQVKDLSKKEGKHWIEYLDLSDRV